MNKIGNMSKLYSLMQEVVGSLGCQCTKYLELAKNVFRSETADFYYRTEGHANIFLKH